MLWWCRGGHCGFLQGLWPFGTAWSDEVMAEFFACMLAHEGAAAALQACKAAAAPSGAAADCSKSRSYADFMHLSSAKVGLDMCRLLNNLSMCICAAKDLSVHACAGGPAARRAVAGGVPQGGIQGGQSAHPCHLLLLNPALHVGQHAMPACGGQPRLGRF
jgi:hypothetical protein